MSKNLKLIFKMTFVCGLLYFLFQKGFISLKDTRNAFNHWDKIIPGMAAFLLTSLLGVVRWQWLLRAQDIHLPWSRTFQLAFIGNFFNIALPGAVSGDFVKAFYIGREIEGKRARAFSSILLDRVTGVSALALVSAGAMIFGIDSFKGTMIWIALKFLVGFSAVGVAVFFTYLFMVREQHDPVLRTCKTIEKRFQKFGSLTRIYEGLRHYHSHRMTVLKVLALSVVIHLIVGWGCFNFAQALGEAHITLLPVYVIVPLGLLVTAIPILPAGVGTGHAAFLYLFHLIGSERGADIFTLTAITSIGLGAFGGLLYLRFKSREPELVPTA